MGCFRDCLNAIRGIPSPQRIEFLRGQSVAGDPHSQILYGNYLISGKGVEKDVSHGLLFLAKAINQTEDFACRAKAHFDAFRNKITATYESIEPLTFQEVMELIPAMSFVQERYSIENKNLGIFVNIIQKSAEENHFNIDQHRSIRVALENTNFGRNDTVQKFINRFWNDSESVASEANVPVPAPHNAAIVIAPADILVGLAQ